MSRTRAVRTGGWAVLLQIVRLGTQAGVFLLFSRYIPLSDLGAYSFAFAFVQLAQIFVRIGVMETFVAAKNIDDIYMSSSILVSGCTGILMSAILFLIGIILNLSGSFSGEIMCVLSIIPLIDSIGIVPEAILRRSLRFSKIALRTTVGLSIAATICLIFGYLGWGVRALVIFNVSASVISMVTAVYMVRKELRVIPVGLDDMRKIAVPSLHLSVSAFATGSIVPASQIALGIFTGPAAVGAYAIAQRILTLFNAVAVDPVRVSALPVLSRLNTDEERRKALLEVLSLCGTVLSPLYMGMAAISPVLLPLVLGANGNSAYPILWVLSFHFAALIISMITTQILLVNGRSREVFRFTSIQSAAGIVMGLAAAPFGPIAVAFAYVARAYLIMPVVLRQGRIYGGMVYREVFGALIVPIISAIVMQIAVICAIKALEEAAWPPVIILVAGIAVGAFVYVSILLVFGRKHLMDMIRLLRSLRGKPAR